MHRLTIPRAHLGEAFGWHRPDAPDWSAMIAAAAGIATPVAIGAAIGRPDIGLVAAVGALWMANAPSAPSLRRHARAIGNLLAVAIVAAIVSAVIGGRPWTGVALVAILGAAALVGGYSRPLAIAAQRFIVFTAIGVGVASGGQHRVALAIIIAEGAIWAALAALTAGAIGRAIRAPAPPPVEPRSTATSAQRWRRWRGTLRTLAGSQYAARLTFCLAAAEVVARLWPAHHFGWIVVAVAILSQRAIERWPVKVTQRAIGVAVGVGLSEVLFAGLLPFWAAIVCFVAIAGAMPLLRRRSYLLYSAAMTPLILLVMSAGAAVTSGVMIDRLVATAIGAALVIAAGRAAAWRIG